jgi:hypothetical protein
MTKRGSVQNKQTAAPIARAERDSSLPATQLATTQTSAARIATILCAALFGCALFFRTWRLGNVPGINGDEAYLAFKAARLAHGEFFHTNLPWMTNADAIPNVFSLLPLAALHLVFAPSVALMRSIAVFSGVLALLLNFFFCRRVFDARTALVSTLLLAALPVNIAYSRFGWEPSQSLGATLVVLYLALLAMSDERCSMLWALLGCVALGAAFVVHPTNIFIAPWLAMAMAWRWGRNLGAAFSPASPLGHRIAVVAGMLALCRAFFLLQKLSSVQRLLAWHSLSEVPLFLLNYQRLFSGITIYRYIPGSCVWPAQGLFSDFCLTDAVAIAVTIVGLFGLCQSIRRKQKLDAFIGACWLASLVAFFIVAGANAISPSQERYGLCLIAPGALALTRGFVGLMEAKPRWKFAVCGGAMALGISLLSGFYLNYFQFFEVTGGRSHPTFSTNTLEPKVAAMAYIQQHRQAGQQTFIVASDWWNYWPLRYLAQNDKSITVLMDDDLGEPQNGRDVDRALQGGRLWFSQFAADTTLESLKRRLRVAGFGLGEKVFFDSSRKPAVVVLRPQPTKEH